MTRTETAFTIQDYEQLPEGFPCQLIEGRFVREPAPCADHQRIVSRLLFEIALVLGPDRVLPSPLDIVIDELSVLQPDVAVFAAPVARGTRRPPQPTLVIEVLSASTEERDRETKSRLYLAAGIPEVWLVHPGTGAIEIRTSSSSAIHPSDTSVTTPQVPGFSTTGHDLVT